MPLAGALVGFRLGFGFEIAGEGVGDGSSVPPSGTGLVGLRFEVGEGLEGALTAGFVGTGSGVSASVLFSSSSSEEGDDSSSCCKSSISASSSWSSRSVYLPPVTSLTRPLRRRSLLGGSSTFFFGVLVCFFATFSFFLASTAVGLRIGSVPLAVFGFFDSLASP